MSPKKAVESTRSRQVSAAARAPSKPKARTIARSAKTGRVVSAAQAKANPDTTVREKVAKGKAKLFKLPKSMGAIADLLYSTRESRLALQKEVDAMENNEKQMKQHLIDNLPKSSSTGAAGKHARVQIVTEDYPAVEDWDSLYAHIKKTGNFELLNRALNRTAVKERWANKKSVPGVHAFTAVKVSVTKV